MAKGSSLTEADDGGRAVPDDAEGMMAAPSSLGAASTTENEGETGSLSLETSITSRGYLRIVKSATNNMRPQRFPLRNLSNNGPCLSSYTFQFTPYSIVGL